MNIVPFLYGSIYNHALGKVLFLGESQLLGGGEVKYEYQKSL